MGVYSNAVIAVAHKNIIYPYVITTHQIYTVTPAFTTERLQILNGQSGSLPAEYRIMVGIHYRNAINQYIFRMSDFYSTNGMIENTTSDDAHIFRFVNQELGFHDGSGSQINRGVGRNPYFRIRQILRQMNAGAEVHHIVPTFGVGFRFQRIGK